MRLAFSVLPLLLLAVEAVFGAPSPGYQAGAASIDITPAGPIWMSGYASRNKPSQGVLQKLHAKALALGDSRGNRVVIVTTDVVGLPRELTDVVGARVEKQFGLPRARLMLNSSHTHTGPMIRGNLKVLSDLSDADQRVVNEYSAKLTDDLVAAVGAAIAAMQPASLTYGEGKTDFAINRRQKTPAGVKIGLNPTGPMDHSVPVLKIAGADGKLKAVLFGYACHNTTLTGEHYQLSGDYAGFAQAAIEDANPGATALFVELCGGDQNPNPRSDLKSVQQHGKSLGTEVQRVLAAGASAMKPVKGRIDAALQWRDIPVQPRTRADYEKMTGDKDVFVARFGRFMLKRLDDRQPMKTVSYPVQALRLGDGLVMVALGGEVVVEYALQIKAANPKLRVIVAGYSNDVMGYVPTAKMLTDEGGYEPIQSTIYYGQPAPWAPEIEQTILRMAADAIKGVKP